MESIDDMGGFFIKVLTEAKKVGINGTELWQQFYNKEPSYKFYEKPDYYQKMREKYQKVFDNCIVEINRRNYDKKEAEAN